MKIDPIHKMNLMKTYNTGKKDVAKTAYIPAGKDGAEISEDAVSFSRALTALRESDRGGTDKARLQELSARIDRGEYSVSGTLVAEKIMSIINLSEE